MPLASDARGAEHYAPPVVEVRRASEADRPELAGMLARAFFDDPVASYIFPDASRRGARLQRFFDYQLRCSYLPDGEVETTPGREGAALWMPPRRSAPTRISPLDRLGFAALLGRGLPATRRLVGLLASHHPPERHIYLGTLGTEPARQGSGVGSALLGAALERCDLQALPAYLECSRQENVAFYARYGFDVATAVDAPGGGPRLWLMWREPVSPR